MSRSAAFLAMAAATLTVAACASMPRSQAARAPTPMKPVDLERFYSGRWHEIARHPMRITDGCVAGTTDYLRGAHGAIIDRDACRMGTPEGKEKVFAGPGRILDPGVNARIRVRYTVFGVFPVVRDYWMLDHDEDYSWFISSDPSFHDLWIFTRNPNVPAAQRAALVERARAMGYDVSQLEFPAQPVR